MAPLVHEFTYQAMAHDLLSIKDGDKVAYRMKINEGTPAEEEKDMELSEKDEVWVKNRHRHMKDTIEKLMGDFQGFLKQNPNFTDDNKDTTSLNAIRDMLAGLPQFQEMKEAYSLHLSMAQESMNVFQARKLPDMASVEQSLATGLDEDGRKPKNTLDQVVRLLDDEAVPSSDRLRLIMMYILFRDGVILEDIKRLVAHAALPPSDGEVISNLELLGAQSSRPLKGFRPPPPPLFSPPVKSSAESDEYALSRFNPAMKSMLEELCKGTLDQAVFPYVKPPMEPDNASLSSAQGSLRAAKPRWAGAGRREAENRQRVLVFMAGGATYSEARTCYEVAEEQRRDVFLATSHMMTPTFFLRQVGDLSVDKRRLDLPMERPKPKAPAHLFERPAPPQPMASGMGGGAGGGGGYGLSTGPGMGMGMAPGFPGGPGGQLVPPSRATPPGVPVGIQSGPRPPTQALASMTLNNSTNNSNAEPPPPPPPVPSVPTAVKGADPGKKLHKKEKEKEKEPKKKRNIFGLKK